MNKTVKTSVQLIFGVIFTGIVIGLIYGHATDMYYQVNNPVYIRAGIVLELALFLLVLVLGKFLLVFSRQVRVSAYWEAWLIANLLVTFEIYSEWRSISKNPENAIGALAIMFVAPPAILLVLIYTTVRSRKIVTKGR